MRIYTLWHEGQDGDLPWLVGAVDEYTVDENGGFPKPYEELRVLTTHRQLIIDAPQKAIRALFEVPEVEAKVVKE